MVRISCRGLLTCPTRVVGKGKIVEGDSFRGVLASQPESIRNLRFRQPVTVTRSQVSDWMIVQDGKAKGCFTMRVLDKRANADQRKAARQRFPFTYE